MGSTLGHIMNMGNESLRNSRLGVEVTGHNIANAHTKGYSRQRVNTQTNHPIQYGKHTIGSGANVAEIQRAHDKYVEMQMRKENQSIGFNTKMSENLSRIEGIFSLENESSIAEKMSQFTNSLREFSTYPEQYAVRINLIESAKNLTHSINETHRTVVRMQDDFTDEVKGELDGLNQKLDEVAKLNGAIKEMSSGTVANRANDLEDRRDMLLREITETIDAQVYLDENQNYAVRGPGGSLLVDGTHASQFRMEPTLEFSQPRFLVYGPGGGNPYDITDKAERGKIGALIRARDVHAGLVRERINDFARNLGDSFNEIHRKGFGIGSFETQNGRDFFKGYEGFDGEPAEGITIVEALAADPSSLSAAFTSGAPGDNILANHLVRMMREPLFENGQTSLLGLYENLQSKIGVESANAKEDAKTSQIIQAQLNSQRESTSGVSIDEEAAELLKYQHMFTASSRLITTADQMFQTILDLKR